MSSYLQTWKPSRPGASFRSGRTVRSDSLGIRIGREIAESSEELVERQGRLARAPLAHCEGVVGLAVAVHDDERDLLELGVADPLPERLVAFVDIHAEAFATQPLAEGLRRLPVPKAYRQDAHLHRREPEGERSRVVLDEDAR